MKQEYLISEMKSRYGFEVMICEDDMIKTKRTYDTLTALLEDAVRWSGFNKRGRVAIEMQTGTVYELAPRRLRRFGPADEAVVRRQQAEGI
jgi:hypothetical protein